jgi:prepilin-type processing-associated H-X9-DG protein
VYGTLPPAYIPDEDGNPKHSWRVLILPFIEQQSLYTMYNFDEPWDSPSNLQLANMMPAVYQCPTAPPGTTTTGYMAISGPGSIFNNEKGSTFQDVTDGTSNTIMVAEVAGASANWMEPQDLDVSTMPMAVNATQDGTSISSHHPGGAQVAMADGSVRFISSNIDQNTLKFSLTKADGQPVMLP